MNLNCPHCRRSVPAVWLLQGADGRIAILVDGEAFAVDVTRTVELNLHLLAAFEEDADGLAHGDHRLDGCARLQVDNQAGWPDGMHPVAIWEAGGRVRLLRDLAELGQTAHAYLWPYTDEPRTMPGPGRSATSQADGCPS